MAKKIGRREFVKTTAKISVSAVLGGSVLSQFSCSQAAKCDIAVASGSDYLRSTSKDLLAPGAFWMSCQQDTVYSQYIIIESFWQER